MFAQNAKKNLEATLIDHNPTTRCFPRRLEDAFRNDPSNSQWFFPPEKYKWNWMDVILVYIGLIIWICLAYYFVRN